jgi:hypothetical protein
MQLESVDFPPSAVNRRYQSDDKNKVPRVSNHTFDNIELSNASVIESLGAFREMPGCRVQRMKIFREIVIAAG